MAEIYPWEGDRVLKLFRGDWPGAARHEFNIARAVYEQGVPTPEPIEIIQVDGKPGIVYTRVQGSSLLGAMSDHPLYLLRYARQMAELHLKIHACRAPELTAARPELKRAIQQQELLPADLKTPLLELLETLPDGDSLLHGDFHPDNLMVGAQGMAIIDWPNAARGCPIADVARTTVILRFGRPPYAFSWQMRILVTFVLLFRLTYTRAYFAASPHSPQELSAWELVLAAHRLGDRIPGENEKLLRLIRRGLARRGM